jgi:hypothetical protein
VDTCFSFQRESRCVYPSELFRRLRKVCQANIREIHLLGLNVTQKRKDFRAWGGFVSRLQSRNRETRQKTTLSYSTSVDLVLCVTYLRLRVCDPKEALGVSSFFTNVLAQ